MDYPTTDATDEELLQFAAANIAHGNLEIDELYVFMQRGAKPLAGALVNIRTRTVKRNLLGQRELTGDKW